jgi:hypothetical protein
MPSGVVAVRFSRTPQRDWIQEVKMSMLTELSRRNAR